MNLLRVRGSVCVRFVGKCWRVKKVSRDGIHLEPSRSTTDVIDFSYGGSGSPSDPHNADRVWRLIHSDELIMDLFARDLRQEVEHFIDQVQVACSENQIPYFRSSEGIRYFTFAGHLVNRAIGLYTRKPGFKADDLSLLVPSPVDWASISIHPSDYEDFFHLLFEPSSGQSLYQKQLPLDLQEREYLQDWLKDKVIPQILVRLVRSKPIEIGREIANSFGYQ